MNPTTIEWALNPDHTRGFTSNPFTGCLGPRGDGINCPYCYAKRLANGRLKPLYLNNFNIPEMWQGEGVFGHEAETKAKLSNPFYPRLWPYRLRDLDTRSPKGIFVCDMGDWAAPWLPMAWKEDLMAAIRRNPQHRIYLLTHQPQELQRWSPYPDNCWVGVTATNPSMFADACYYLKLIKATVKYLSFEPLLAFNPLLEVLSWHHWIYNWLLQGGINWLIIGACTGSWRDIVAMSAKYPALTALPYLKKWTLQPKKESVKEIINAADKAQIPVFLKDNLKPLFPETFRDREYAAPPFFTPDWDYRQEMPDSKEK